MLVFIHGLGCSAKGFSSALLSEDLKDFSLLTIDLVGHGHSQKLVSFSYTLEDQAQICLKLLKGLWSDDIHLVGHSMGGAVAILLAQSLKCRSFSSIEGNLVAEDCGPISRTPISMSLQDYEQIGFDQTKTYLSNYAAGTFYLEETSALAFYRSSQSLVQLTDSNQLLSMMQSLDTRSAYIFGEKNADMPVVKQIQAPIASIQIPNASHFPMVENPVYLYRALADFIRGQA